MLWCGHAIKWLYNLFISYFYCCYAFNSDILCKIAELFHAYFSPQTTFKHKFYHSNSPRTNMIFCYYMHVIHFHSQSLCYYYCVHKDTHFNTFHTFLMLIKLFSNGIAANVCYWLFVVPHIRTFL